jgi:hypothetical protein
MTDPTLTISLSRSVAAGGPTALAFSGALDATALGIVRYQPPARQSRVTYAPDSVNVHGSEAIGAAWQQAILGFDWMLDGATTEAAVQAAYAAVVAAIGQFSYTVTTQVSGATAQVWAADMGSATPPARSYVDLAHPNAWVCAVTIPVYPIAS